ncbi:MAG: hypothetical protein AAGI34_14270 [Pseudomonadota bacterium]
MSQPSPATPKYPRRLSDASARERLFVGMLRYWFDGPTGQQALWQTLTTHLGVGDAQRLLSAFAAFLQAVTAGLRYDLNRPGVECPDLGGDEARLVAIVLAAGRQDRVAARAEIEGMIAEAEQSAVLDAAGRLGVLLVAIDKLDDFGKNSSIPRRASPTPMLH